MASPAVCGKPRPDDPSPNRRLKPKTARERNLSRLILNLSEGDETPGRKVRRSEKTGATLK